MDKPIIESLFHYKNYTCCVLFQPLGFRCGYVLIPKWHKLYEQDYNDINGIYCHGGLTYSSHVLVNTEYPGWWIGFDCAHAGDGYDRESQSRYFGTTKQDSFFSMLNYMTGNYSEFGTVKTLDFCIQECKNIVDQLEEIDER
jgi:hypothetical protein